MIDLHTTGHIHNDSWGVLQFFQVGSIKIPTYSFFVFLGLIVGILIVFFLSRTDKKNNENMFYIVFAGLIGGTLGAKIPIWIAYFSTIFNSGSIEAILSGRTITGGLIGGTLAVIITKQKLGIKTRFGNNLVPGIIAGIAIGRIGCFLAGCCYGEVTTLPWGINFGDDLLRHPTQIYEIIYLSLLFIGYIFLKNKKNRPGFLFDLFLLFYFGYRFLIEFIRVEPVIFYGFTGYQIASIIVVLFVLVKINYFRLKKY